LSRPHSSRSSSPGSYVRVNGKIRAREVRVIGPDGSQVGILSLAEAINMARSRGMDLVEVAPTATPPVCRVVDYGKFRYEQSKKEKESRKHQHANRMKEVQLSASIDFNDFGVKLGHAIDFLCEEMKVKVSLRFRGREMMHQEIGQQVVDRFIKELAPFSHPDAPPKLVGRGLNVILSPLPRNKRAKNPREVEGGAGSVNPMLGKDMEPLRRIPVLPSSGSTDQEAEPAERASGGFANNPFGQLDARMGQRPAA